MIILFVRQKSYSGLRKNGKDQGNVLYVLALRTDNAVTT